MTDKMNDFSSYPRNLNGGGPKGATFGILEYLSQSNHSADCVGQENRFKFVDDLTTLEIINLITIGLSTFNSKNQVPSDIPHHNQYIPPEHLKSQKYLDKISKWTDDKKMLINEKKTKCMIFNFSEKY